MKTLLILAALFLGSIPSYGQESGIDLQRKIRIPVIFHVVYSNRNHEGRRDGGNTQENLATPLIIAELEDLQKDFMLLNSDTSQVIPKYKNIIGNPNISFVLADTILQPNGERGIIRVYNKNNGSNLHEKSEIVDPARYFNVYIGDIGNFTPTSPWSSPLEDAVFISYAWVGLKYRLLTHEAGHWCGLFHPWGTGGGKGDRNSCTIGDEIDDTPPQYEATEPNGDCVICPKVGSKQDKTCDKTKNNPANFNNFMDYSGCRKMFTRGQVIEIRKTLREHRRNIWNNATN